ncbi:MAG: hypothetical protein JW939_03450 [Candidatus Thermoplasmatota archaeon]|nr:hypothetical protein [Candidatus Thermoplasmatota archaeon]
MKVTCSTCSRRVRVRPGIPYPCRCGQVINVFPGNRYLDRFRKNDHEATRELKESFFNGSSPERKEEILELLFRSVDDKRTRWMGLLASVEILRQIEGANFLDLARALVKRYPRDFTMRFMIANCLDLTDDRNDHIEALKQRMMGTTLQCFMKMRREGLDEEMYDEILKRHLSKLGSEKRFLLGESEHSCTKVRRIASGRRPVESGLLPRIRELEEIWRRAGLSRPGRVQGKKKCILDTNAFSDISASRHFGNPHVHFMAPLAVLMELTEWCNIRRFPLEMEHVTFKEVTSKIPLEIDQMFSKFKGKEPSLTDKKVATLALEERADVIVSGDRDLWDSGLEYQLEKNYGIGLKVIKPEELERWIRRSN